MDNLRLEEFTSVSDDGFPSGSPPAGAARLEDEEEMAKVAKIREELDEIRIAMKTIR
jgi:hypothetical protein